MILQAKVCVADITQKCRRHYIFGDTFFMIHILVSVADCGYVNFFCSYLSKNEAVKFNHLLYLCSIIMLYNLLLT